MSNQQNHWQTANLAAIQQRLTWLQEQPDGIIFCEPSGVHYVVVRKDQSQIRVALVEKIHLHTDLVQSIFYFDSPLYLVSEYTQAMLLSLVWKSTPKKIYLAGFGGGRIPLLLHHYFPEATIESTDIDATAITVAQKFFGVQFDEQLRVAVQDGRQYLEQQNQEVCYDIILIDVAFGNGYMPHRLATKEFYEICQQHLTKEGIIAINLLQRDPFYGDKVKTLQSIFSQVYICPWRGVNSVLFGSNSVFVSKDDLISRAKSLQTQHQFLFPLIERAMEVKVGKELAETVPNLDTAQILRDESPPEGYFNSWLL